MENGTLTLKGEKADEVKAELCLSDEKITKATPKSSTQIEENLHYETNNTNLKGNNSIYFPDSYSLLNALRDQIETINDKVESLTTEMKNIKELKTLPNTDEDIITDLRQEIQSLKKENDELIKRQKYKSVLHYG